MVAIAVLNLYHCSKQTNRRHSKQLVVTQKLGHACKQIEPSYNQPKGKIEEFF